VASEQSQEYVQQARQAFTENLEQALFESGKVSAEDLIFVDETGLRLEQDREYGRARYGQRVAGKQPRCGNKNITLVGAMDLTGIIAAMYCLCTFAGDAFIGFIEHHLAPYLHKGKIVIMDNVPFHKIQAVLEAMKKTGATVVFLPPYSPDMNPIELAWSKIKATLKSLKTTCYDDFRSKIKTAIESVNSNDAQGWFEHCNYSLV
jgi:transposase